MWEYAAISKPGIWPHRLYDPSANIGLMKEQLATYERKQRRIDLEYSLRLFVMAGVGSQDRRLIAEVGGELAALKLGITIPTVNFVPRSHPEAPGRMG